MRPHWQLEVEPGLGMALHYYSLSSPYASSRNVIPILTSNYPKFTLFTLLRSIQIAAAVLPQLLVLHLCWFLLRAKKDGDISHITDLKCYLLTSSGFQSKIYYS